MAPTATIIQPIEKEQIKNLHFPKEEVLPQKTDQVNRLQEIKRALALGNLEHLKVNIIFIDSEGFKKVETTIWGFTEKMIILKQGTLIPVERVYDII
jgi:hypothetical protein